MELPSLDLNLVVVLHALLEERNVTRAGQRVGLSQPGTSAALARLRRHFHDPLLDRVGTRYELTPLAQGLYDQLGETLDHLQRVLKAQPQFDPGTTGRRFVVRCSDAVLTVLAPLIVAEVAQAAPDVVLDFRTIDHTSVTDPVRSLSEIDILIAPRGLFSVPEMSSVELYEDRWLCATWTGNTQVGEALTIDEVRRARWVMPYQEVLMASPADAALAALGVDRHCAVRVENFTILGQLVVGTNLLVLLHERLASRYTNTELRRVELPQELAPVTEVAWWHPSRRLDPGHRWFIELIQRAASTVARIPVDTDSP
ncbi:LysR family transcriptional regulator [Nocardia noduli]|uniref:LysR family transcriptional regulator n=1 Tax=Nocardia noduli TaxID=2815722 RepID=UPI001C2147EA|nr:LysR family transcriptional regulator [Nocardia noduli]